jgi:hypothetical protein
MGLELDIRMQIFEEEGNSKDFLMDPYFSVEETE